MLDIEAIKKRRLSRSGNWKLNMVDMMIVETDIDALLTEVERLRAENKRYSSEREQSLAALRRIPSDD